MDLAKLDEEISNVEIAIESLRLKRKSLIKLRKKHRPDEHVDRLVELLKTDNVGASRKIVEAVFPELSDQEISNVLARAQNRGVVENLGNRKHPRWFYISGGE